MLRRAADFGIALFAEEMARECPAMKPSARCGRRLAKEERLAPWQLQIIQGHSDAVEAGPDYARRRRNRFDADAGHRWESEMVARSATGASRSGAYAVVAQGKARRSG